MKPLFISFSGGRTSGYMTKILIDKYRGFREIFVIYANTGQENEKTLEFINNCDKYLGFNAVWIEAVVHHGQRKANTHKLVSYETACRDGYLFEEMVKKHGIPNMAFPHCTRELKLSPIKSYINSIGYKLSDGEMAIGIRSDEIRRVREDAEKVSIIYPLVEMGIDKTDVLNFWSEQSFDLDILEHQGNCKWCWKKSEKKHMRIISENPEYYDVPRMLEEKYPHVGPHKDKSRPRTFFRGNKSTDILFKLYDETMGNLLPISNEDSGCSESCELFATY